MIGIVEVFDEILRQQVRAATAELQCKQLSASHKAKDEAIKSLDETIKSLHDTIGKQAEQLQEFLNPKQKRKE